MTTTQACRLCLHILFYKQWRIQDFPEVKAPNLRGGEEEAATYNFAEFSKKCMKFKEFGPPKGVVHPSRPPLDMPVIN